MVSFLFRWWYIRPCISPFMSQYIVIYGLIYDQICSYTYTHTHIYMAVSHLFLYSNWASVKFLAELINLPPNDLNFDLQTSPGCVLRKISSRIHFWGLEGPEMVKNGLNQRFSIKSQFSWGRPRSDRPDRPHATAARAGPGTAGPGLARSGPDWAK